MDTDNVVNFTEIIIQPPGEDSTLLVWFAGTENAPFLVERIPVAIFSILPVVADAGSQQE